MGSTIAGVQDPRHALLKLSGTERFPEVALPGLLDARRQVLLADGGGEQKDRDVARLLGVAENFDDLETGSLRHDDVEHARVGPMSQDQTERLLAIGGANRFVSRLLQGQADEVQDVFVVVGDQDHASVIIHSGPPRDDALAGLVSRRGRWRPLRARPRPGSVRDGHRRSPSRWGAQGPLPEWRTPSRPARGRAERTSAA